MDEILLHISQRLEALQVFFYSSLQSSRVSLESYSETISAFSVRSRELVRSGFHHVSALTLSSRSLLGTYADSAWRTVSPHLVTAQERLLDFLLWLRELVEYAWQLLYQNVALWHVSSPAEGSEVVTSSLTTSRSEIRTGIWGFLIGCVTGLLIGCSWQHRPIPPAVFIKAVVAPNFSGIDGVVLADDVGCPAILQPDEVMVEVVAASVDSTDIALCSGYARSLCRHIGSPRQGPIILGRDCSGVILEAGRNVKWLARGDAVWLAVPPWQSGCMAQLVVVRESQVSLKPQSLNFEAAASLPYAALRAWRAAVVQAGLGPETATGKRVLVRDAGCGVGCILVQLARCWGAHVTAVVTPRAKEVARQMGASEVLVTSVDLEMDLRAQPRFDIIFNTAGPSLLPSCRRVCAPEGKIVCTALPVLSPDSYGLLLTSVHTLWVKAKCLLKGSAWMSRDWGSLSSARADLEELRALVEQGSLQPVLDRVFSASDVDVAFQHAVSPNAVGKTVVHFRYVRRE